MFGVRHVIGSLMARIVRGVDAGLHNHDALMKGDQNYGQCYWLLRAMEYPVKIIIESGVEIRVDCSRCAGALKWSPKRAGKGKRALRCHHDMLCMHLLGLSYASVDCGYLSVLPCQACCPGV